ncbi:hypothetical protein EVG20_g4738 [Dentipellis fragilis]|uniref:Uncharacterized protein n=1 Tax=Dentipellis fragilis TaxID=205917 RepID=A0A4Y9YX70_9AGAM|nr:hypothetical protein EVG20_g4738 [Dentipellis fragilis]
MVHSQIISALPSSFEKARTAGDLLFFPSEVHEHEDCGVKFEIRLCPALLHKPNIPTPHFDAASIEAAAATKKPDPFAPPYNSTLYVSEFKDEDEGIEYAILLNKYSVVPNHFLMVTKDYQSQASPLVPSDLKHAYSILLAARKAGQHFFAFYNCGDQSGASQSHKHLQFIPVEEEDGPPLERVARAAHIESEYKPFALPSLPFANHVRRLSISPSASADELEHKLASAFMELLDLCISTVRLAEDHPAGMPSYNVVLTLQHLYVLPRRWETHVLSATGDKLSINALGFAGMLLVKSHEELEAVRLEGPAAILRAVGCQSVHELQVNDGPAVDDSV